MAGRRLSLLHLLFLVPPSGRASAFAFAPGGVSRATARTGLAIPPASRSRASAALLLSAAGGGDLSSAAAAADQRKRRRRVEAGYAASAVAWTATVAVVGGAVVKWVRAGTATSASLGLGACVVASRCLPLVLAGVGRDAARDDRLAGDAYRRLNAALLCHSLLILAAAATGRGRRPNFAALPAGASLLTAVSAFKGWWYGARGWDTPKSGAVGAMAADAVGLLSDSLAGCFSKVSNIAAAAYLAVTYFASYLTWVRVKMAIAAAGDPSAVAAQLLVMSTYLLVASMAYTLKDAADRNNLEPLEVETFLRLNLALTLVFGSLSFYWNAIGAGTRLVAASAATAALAAMNGFLSLGKGNSGKE